MTTCTPDWVCPVCRHALEARGEELACGGCGRTYPVDSGIPILVEDAPVHLAEMQKAIAGNPAWYESTQIAWYDHGPCRHHLARRRRTVEAMLRSHLGEGNRAARLLDLGCGDGANARWLQAFAERIDGCDYNPVRLRSCQHLLGDSIRLALANLHRLPYADATFDVVFCNHVLEHVPDDEHALQSVLRVLRPGGLCILGVPNEGAAWWRLAYRLAPQSLAQTDHVHFYRAGDIAEKVRQAGFEVLAVEPTGWGPPHWKLDERLRQFRRVDDLFERLGKRLAPGQASSLYLKLRKPGGPDAQEPSHSPIEIRLYDSALASEWDALVERSPQGWLFHRRSFIDIAGAAMGLRECSLAAVKSGRLVAILPLSFPLEERPPKLGSLAFGSAGPALDPDLGAHEVRAILALLWQRALRLAREHGCRTLMAALPPLAPAQLANARGVSPLDEWRFVPASTSTYIVDLATDEETLFANLRTLARRQIRRAESRGVTVRRADRPGDLDSYYTIHSETYRRTGVMPHPRAYFEGIFREMQPAGLTRIYAAEMDGTAIAFLNVARYKQGAFFWTGCSTDAALEAGANYLLQWHAMREAREEGLLRYEVGEAFPGHRGDKLAGLDAFKSAFGGERWPFHKGRIDLSPAGGRPSRGRLALYYLKRSLRALAGKA